MDNLENADLNEILVFTAVADAGSFSAAARTLRMPNSTVSAKVSSLERRLGATLLQRTTRRVSLTDAGRTFFARAADALGALKTAEAELRAGSGVARGILRVSAPFALGASVLPDVVRDFHRLHPGVRLELLFSDQNVDLVGERVDLALRAGHLPDSSLVAKKLGTVYFAPFASRAYLHAAGAPKTPRDLPRHRTLAFRALGENAWALAGPRGPVRVPLAPDVVTNDLALLKSLALAGGGIALLPTFVCYAEVQDKSLVRVLPEWRSHTQPVHFVYPAQKFLPPKLKAFVEVAETPLKASLRSFEL